MKQEPQSKNATFNVYRPKYRFAVMMKKANALRMLHVKLNKLYRKYVRNYFVGLKEERKRKKCATFFNDIQVVRLDYLL